MPSVDGQSTPITTLYNVCAVPGGAQYHGVFSTVGNIMSTVRDILSTVGVFSTMGDIMSTMGVILSTVGDVQYCGGCSVPWGYHDVRGDIMSTVEGVQYRGGKSFVI